MHLFLATLLLFSLPLAGVWADEIADKSPSLLSQSPIGTETLFSTVGGLILVLALIVGLAWAFKRFAHLPKGNGEVVKIIGGASLGPRERVVVVEVNETRLLLGVAPGRVQMLHVLGEKNTEQQIFAGKLKNELDGVK